MKTVRKFPKGRAMHSVRALALAVPLLVLGAACSNLERSREMSNPATPAKTLALQVCSNCHGVTGVSISPNFPRLAGQQPDYFINQMKAFRGHSRSDPAGFEYMWGLSRGLTDEQIKGLAEYFAAQAPQPGEPTDPALRSAGQAIFEGGVPATNVPACKTCHGESGQGMAAFPRLADQHADYLVKQLQVFQRSNERPEGSVMKEIAHGLTQPQMTAVAAFLQDFPAK